MATLQGAIRLSKSILDDSSKSTLIFDQVSILLSSHFSSPREPANNARHKVLVVETSPELYVDNSSKKRTAPCCQHRRSTPFVT